MYAREMFHYTLYTSHVDIVLLDNALQNTQQHDVVRHEIVYVKLERCT